MHTGLDFAGCSAKPWDAELSVSHHLSSHTPCDLLTPMKRIKATEMYRGASFV